ncbi:nucleoside hydrolase [Luteimonas pelagia]
MANRIPLLIDTDPGIDDALAILMAFADDAHDVVGLTVAAGNVGLEHTLRNALKLRETAGRESVPVFAGCAEPLLHPAEDAAFVHGEDGFGDAGLPAPPGTVEPEHASLAILRLSHAHAGRLVLVALGPLTNIALALKLDPTLHERIARLVVMGGAVTARGNITAAAEFNIAVDPEAAQIVFEGFPPGPDGPRIELVDWEAVLRHGFPLADFEAWLAADTGAARFYDAISRQARARAVDRRGDRWHSADALAMAQALAPSGGALVPRPMCVELDGRHTRGATVVDWERRGGAPDNVAILASYDQSAFEARLQAALGLPAA